MQASGLILPAEIKDVSNVLENMKKSLPKRDSFVLIVNEPKEYDSNDYFLEVTRLSLEMTKDMNFKKYTVLDNRNADKAAEIIKGADFLLLWGGRILCQKEFLDRINFKSLLKDFTGLVYGFSAGAMNLCETICNFPESEEDLNEPRLVQGQGFSKRYIIPHFDPHRVKYTGANPKFDIVKDYIMPYSDQFELTALDNNAYILMKDGKETFYGDYCFIKNRKVTIPQKE